MSPLCDIKCTSIYATPTRQALGKHEEVGVSDFPKDIVRKILSIPDEEWTAHRKPGYWSRFTHDGISLNTNGWPNPFVGIFQRGRDEQQVMVLVDRPEKKYIKFDYHCGYHRKLWKKYSRMHKSGVPG